MSEINDQARAFIVARLSPEELDRRLTRVENECEQLIRPLLTAWKDETSQSPSSLIAVAARLLGLVMVIGDGIMTEFETQGGVIGDDGIVSMVDEASRAYATAIRENIDRGQRVN